MHLESTCEATFHQVEKEMGHSAQVEILLLTLISLM